MAITAEQQTSIVQLVVGMVGIAPRPEDLAALAAELEAGSSLVQIAQNIVDLAAYSGDTGLFPNFLPNGIWADNYLTLILGDEVSATTLAAAIAQATADLNAGATRAEVSVATIAALSADTPATGYADAAAALANKTTVAEYYAVNSTAVDANITAMTAAIADVDSVTASVAAGTAAVDDVVAAAAPVQSLIDNLTSANAAKKTFLVEADGDGKATTSTTDAALGGALAGAEGTVDGLVGGAAYAGASDALKAGLLSDQQVLDAGVLTGANTALATALNKTAGTGSVTGLDAAVAALTASITASDAAIEAAALTDVALTEAEGNYDVLNGNGVGTTVATGTGTVAGLIVVSGTTLVLDAGVTEALNPGVTALLAASLANEGADAAAAGALTAANSANDNVENLDTTGARDTELLLVEAIMAFITPATATAPTVAEMTAEQSALNAGIAQLNADLAAVAFDTDDATTTAAHDALTAAAVTAGFITAGQKVTIDGVFATPVLTDQATTDAAAVLSQGSLATNSIGVDFAAAVVAYNGVGTAVTGGMTVATALGLAPLALAANGFATAVGVAQKTISDLAKAVTAEDTLEALIAAGAVLDKAVTAAVTAFTDAGFAAPVTLDSAVKAATTADDLFTTGGIDSQIISFSGDDTLYIGAGLTLNADTTPAKNGDNAVLEVWITGTTSTVITIESSVFGSEAADPEVYTITLTGVAAADVSFADGFVTIG